MGRCRALDHHAKSGNRLGFRCRRQRQICVAFGEFAIEIPDGSADPVLAPARQTPKSGMRDRNKAAIGAPLRIRRPCCKRPHPAIERRPHDLQEKPLNDLGRALEFDGMKLLWRLRVNRCEGRLWIVFAPGAPCPSTSQKPTPLPSSMATAKNTCEKAAMMVWSVPIAFAMLADCGSAS